VGGVFPGGGGREVPFFNWDGQAREQGGGERGLVLHAKEKGKGVSEGGGLVFGGGGCEGGGVAVKGIPVSTGGVNGVVGTSWGRVFGGGWSLFGRVCGMAKGEEGGEHCGSSGEGWFGRKGWAYSRGSWKGEVIF